MKTRIYAAPAVKGLINQVNFRVYIYNFIIYVLLKLRNNLRQYWRHNVYHGLEIDETSHGLWHMAADLQSETSIFNNSDYVYATQIYYHDFTIWLFHLTIIIRVICLYVLLNIIFNAAFVSHVAG